MTRGRPKAHGPAPRKQPQLHTVGRREQPAMPPGRRKPGRPSLLTPLVEERFIGSLRAGNTYADAARSCGLSPETVEKWLKRGRGDDLDRPPTYEHVRFARLAEQARAEAKVMIVGNLVKRSAQDHNAALAWLRHEDPSWRPGAYDDDFPTRIPPAPRLPPGETTGAIAAGTHVEVDARSVVIQMTGDQVPPFVAELLAKRRETLAALPPPAIAHEVPDGPSGLRDSGLRSD